MINSYKGREVKAGQQVKVYFNLHKKVFSIKDTESGLVLAHGNNITLLDATFTVSEAGRLRVIAEKVKNVHAYVVGTYKGAGDEYCPSDLWSEAYYNPYKVDSFVDSLSGNKVTTADEVNLDNKTVWYS